MIIQSLANPRWRRRREQREIETDSHGLIGQKGAVIFLCHVVKSNLCKMPVCLANDSKQIYILIF